MTLTGEILQRVAARQVPATIRVFQPGPTVAFGRRDAFSAGFQHAVQAAQNHGFSPVVRHAGGHAVAYEENSVVVEWMRPEEHLFGGIEERFEDLVALLEGALEGLGVEVQVGELPGEPCPGRFSLHLADGPKVVGVAQRVIKGASLTTAVIAVGAGDRLRAVTASVYLALGLPLDVFTVGAIADRFGRIDARLVAETIATRATSHFQQDQTAT